MTRYAAATRFGKPAAMRPGMGRHYGRPENLLTSRPASAASSAAPAATYPTYWAPSSDSAKPPTIAPNAMPPFAADTLSVPARACACEAAFITRI